jgi:hypothetical protein
MSAIESAIHSHSLRDQGLHFDGLRNVSPDKNGFPALFRDHMDRLVSALLIRVRNDQFGPFSGKGQRSGSPNA